MQKGKQIGSKILAEEHERDGKHSDRIELFRHWGFKLAERCGGVESLDRNRLLVHGGEPRNVMTEAAQWIKKVADGGRPILVAYPLSFDWSWLYWYFMQLGVDGSPFNHSLCYDVKTASAVKAGVPISEAGKSKLLPSLRPQRAHTHNALEDAVEQAEIFTKIFRREGKLWDGYSRKDAKKHPYG